MELEFHKKRHYRYLKRHYRVSYGAIKFKKKICMLKCYDRTPYEAIRLKKKNLHVLKRHYRVLKNCIELKFMKLEFQ